MSIAARRLAKRAGISGDVAVGSVQRDVPITARDGVQLLTDIWWPHHDSGRPIVVMRTPYGRRGSAPFAEILAGHGYPVIVQSCRGTFGSGGVFRPLADEVDDGADLLSWIARQGWGNRKISLVGSSYTGFTALALLSGRPSNIDAVALAVTTSDFRRVIHPDGVLGLETALTWLDGLRIQEWTAPRIIATLLRRGRRMRSAIAGPVAVADTAVYGSPHPAFQGWTDPDSPSDPLWNSLDLTAVLSSIPRGLSVVGAFDLFGNAQLEDYEAQRASGNPARLVFGPWSHAHKDLPPLFVRETLQLLDGTSEPEALVSFTGSGRRSAFPVWPPATGEVEYPLTAASSATDSAGLEIPVDPADPPPAAGGRGLDPAFAGASRQRAREAHRGVASFDGARFEEPLTIVGRASVQISVRPAGHDQDVFVRVTDVDLRGTSRNVADGYLRVPASQDSGTSWQRVTVALSAAAHEFDGGHHLRLQVSGTGQPWHPAPSGAPTVLTFDQRSVSVTLPTHPTTTPHART